MSETFHAGGVSFTREEKVYVPSWNEFGNIKQLGVNSVVVELNSGELFIGKYPDITKLTAE